MKRAAILASALAFFIGSAFAEDRSGVLGTLLGAVFLFPFALVFATAFVFGIFCSWLAGEKGRNSGGWFFLGLLFGPIALFSLGFAPALQRIVVPPVMSDAEHRPRTVDEKKKVPWSSRNYLDPKSGSQV